MIAPLANSLTGRSSRSPMRCCQQSMWREAANERDLKLEQAVQFLNGPDFIPAESQPKYPGLALQSGADGLNLKIGLPFLFRFQ